MATFKTHMTPNPNSIKITTDHGPFIDEGMLSFNSPMEAADHPLGKELFRVSGLASVFVLPEFLTITKHPAAQWDEILPTVKSVLKEYFMQRA